MAGYNCIQGDSFSIDIYSDDIPTFDVNWTGSWAIVDAIPRVAIAFASGSLVHSTDNTRMECRVLPADTNGIAVGKYYLVVELTNSTTGFNQEVVQESFTIKPQGI